MENIIRIIVIFFLILHNFQILDYLWKNFLSFFALWIFSEFLKKIFIEFHSFLDFMILHFMRTFYLFLLYNLYLYVRFSIRFLRKISFDIINSLISYINNLKYIGDNFLISFAFLLLFPRFIKNINNYSFLLSLLFLETSFFFLELYISWSSLK